MLKNGLIETGDGTPVERAATFVTKAGDAVAAVPPVAAVLARTAEVRRERSSSRSPLTFVLPLAGLLAILGAAFAWRNRDRVMEVAGNALARVEGAVGRLTSGNGGDAETTEPWAATAAEPSDPWPATAAEEPSDAWRAPAASPVGSLPA